MTYKPSVYKPSVWVKLARLGVALVGTLPQTPLRRAHLAPLREILGCTCMLLRGRLLVRRLCGRLAGCLVRLARRLVRLASRQRGRVVALHVGRGYLGLRELKSTRVPRRLTRLRHEAAVDSFTANWLNENQLFYRFSAEPVTCRGTDH